MPSCYTFGGNTVLVSVIDMAKKKRKGNSDPAGERFGLRVDADWMDRVIRQAERLGMSASSYIRQAVVERLERDEANEPKPAGK